MLASILLSYATLALSLPIPGWLMPEPLSDSFYNAPDNLSSLKVGEVYDTRQVQPDLSISVSFSEAYQIAYKTTNTQGEDSHTIATVFKPLIPSAEHRLFSLQFWEDSAELNCSPSYSMIKGLTAPDGFTASNDAPLTIDFALSQGWTVVVPDHEGPRSAFLGGYEQGQAGLDGIRAALNYLGWPTTVPVALYGYSGGASASVWMSNLQPSYAPELNIVGAAHGGTPVDIRQTVEHLDLPTNGFSGFIVGAFAGLLHAYPSENETVWPHFNADLKQHLIEISTPDNCILTEVLKDGYHEYHTEMDIDIFSDPTLSSVMSRESLLANVSTGVLNVPKFPRYIFHADGDEIIPAGAVRQYVAEQCAAGANIQYVPWLGNDHISIEFLGIPDAYQFLIQAFEGKTPNVLCGTPNDDVLTLGSKLVGATIGQGIADLLAGFSDIVQDGIKIAYNPNTPYQQGQLP